MEFIFEFIFELIFEGGMEVTSNRKISKWIRYPILVVLLLFFIAIIGLIMFMGIISLKNTIIGGLFIIGLGIFMLVACIIKFRQFYLKEKESIKENDKTIRL